MARESKPPEPVEDIPAWFMTYSDVITLLMTFFILLLTFASSEPEKFERLQVSLFSGAGATGFAGPSPNGQEKDSFAQRTRPRASRITMDGSKMPPTHKDAPTVANGGEVAGLTKEELKPTSERFEVQFRRNLIFNEEKLTAQAHRVAHGMAAQLKRLPIDVTLLIASPDHRKEAMAFAQHLVTNHGVLPGRIAIGYRQGDPSMLGALMIRQVKKQ